VGHPVSGAVPYQPRMTKAQSRDLIAETLGKRVRLAEYRSTVAALSNDERELLIEQALLMLEQVFVHLPLKRALHGTDPIQRLRLLKLRHARLDERAFQSEMIDIFVHLRDLHTNYILPEGYWSKFAFLPFRVEEFYEAGVRRYVVSWVSPVNTVSSLKTGVVVTHWNGSPIDLAVARNAEREAGSNLDARHAHGVEALTLRWLGMSLPPDEDWVTLTYADGAKTHEARFEWEVIDGSDRPQLLAGLGGGGTEAGLVGTGWGIDLKATLLQRVRTALFDPQATQVQAEAAEYRSTSRAEAAPAPRADTSRYPDVYPRFGTMETPSGSFGYVRLKTFAPKSENGGDVVEEAVQEFARILSVLPSTGLILDVRGNGGGYIGFGERILQFLTPREIAPAPFHFMSTALTLQIAAATDELGGWKDGIAQGIETGSVFSQGFPLTPPERCNDVGQLYQGPVVLVTDALCYSTTDIFAAGFQDHEIGTIMGVHENTGAGGANVWDHAKLLQRLTLAPNPFGALPGGAGMRVAARRCTRVGTRSGVPLEELGVKPDVRYYMTRNDVLDHNVDLIAAAAGLLSKQQRHALRLTQGGNPAQIAMAVENLDRVDLLLNGRPMLSLDVKTGTKKVSLPFQAPADATLTGKGYLEGKLVVSTRLVF